MTGKWTPGPLRLVEVETWPFAIRIVDAAGETVDEICRYAYSSEQKSLDDLRAAVGFKHSERVGVIAANERQLADLRLRAAAPALYEALLATRALVSEGAADGFTDHAWMERLFHNQAAITKALSQALGEGK